MRSENALDPTYGPKPITRSIPLLSFQKHIMPLVGKICVYGNNKTGRTALVKYLLRKNLENDRPKSIPITGKQSNAIRLGDIRYDNIGIIHHQFFMKGEFPILPFEDIGIYKKGDLPSEYNNIGSKSAVTHITSMEEMKEFIAYRHQHINDCHKIDAVKNMHMKYQSSEEHCSVAIKELLEKEPVCMCRTALIIDDIDPTYHIEIK